eukprot:scaffold572_cov223-Prasinococcus_capsulatus_cf.AAC.2
MAARDGDDGGGGEAHTHRLALAYAAACQLLYDPSRSALAAEVRSPRPPRPPPAAAASRGVARAEVPLLLWPSSGGASGAQVGGYWRRGLLSTRLAAWALASALDVMYCSATAAGGVNDTDGGGGDGSSGGEDEEEEEDADNDDDDEDGADGHADPAARIRRRQRR